MYWLAIITVKKVLSRWDLQSELTTWEGKYLSGVQEILELAEALLAGEIEFLEAHEILVNDFWYFSHNFVNYEISCLKNAAILAISVIMYCDRTGLGSPNDIYSDNDTNMTMDYICEAVKAYIATDINSPGAVDNEQVVIPIIFDAQKRLEFWEWWLREAVPQAWDLAQYGS